MRVSEVMTEATLTDAPGATLAEAARKMWEQQAGSLLVMDGDQLVGIVTERDVLRGVASGLPLADTRISDVMSKDPFTVGPGTSLRECAKEMNERWIRHIPVMDAGKVVGIVSQRDLAQVLADALQEPETLAQLVGASQLARERRLQRIEHWHWD
jgi:predicted transcriptional regulator